LIELKEAEEKSLKESERLEKEIVEVQELKVIKITSDFSVLYNFKKLSYCHFFFTEKAQYHDGR